MKIIVILVIIFIFPFYCNAQIDFKNNSNEDFEKAKNKYSYLFNENIPVYFTDTFENPKMLGATVINPKNNALGNKFIILKKSGYEKECRNSINTYCFEFVLLHEICHFYWPNKSEMDCDKYALSEII